MSGTTGTVIAKDASSSKLSARDANAAPGAHPFPHRTEGQSGRFLNTRFPLALALFLAFNTIMAVFDNSHERVLSQSVIQSSESEARQQGPWPWWVARAYVMREKAPDIVLFGSSQMGSATFCADALSLKQTIDCVVHRQMSTLEMKLKEKTGRHFDTANLAVSGGMVSDALMFSRALFTESRKPKLVIASISPRDFIDNDLPGPSATDTFKFLAPYAVLDDLQSAAYPDWLSRADWLVGRYLPMKKSQRQVIAAINQQLDPFLSHLSDRSHSGRSTVSGAMPGQKTALLQAISGAAGDVKPGDWVIPAVMPKLWVDNTREYLHRYRKADPPTFGHEQVFFKALLADMKKNGIAVLVVEMPSLPMNSSLLPASFWNKYQGWLKETCQHYDAQLCDLSHSHQFTSDDYLDTVHLNAQGGNRFFEILSEAVMRSPKLSAAINRQGSPTEKDPDDLGSSAAVGSWN